MNILNSTKYRKDFRNLLPWSPSLYTGGDSSGSRAVTLAWTGEGNAKASLQFMGEHIVIFRKYGDFKSTIYHPADGDVCDKLADYILKYGIKAED